MDSAAPNPNDLELPAAVQPLIGNQKFPHSQLAHVAAPQEMHAELVSVIKTQEIKIAALEAEIFAKNALLSERTGERWPQRFAGADDRWASTDEAPSSPSPYSSCSPREMRYLCER